MDYQEFMEAMETDFIPTFRTCQGALENMDSGDREAAMDAFGACLGRMEKAHREFHSSNQIK